MKRFAIVFSTALLALGCMLSAGAQQVPAGQQPAPAQQPPVQPATRLGQPGTQAEVGGIIEGVNGTILMVSQSDHVVWVNDAPAMNGQSTGKIEVGRFIHAHGHWRNGTFVATAITTNTQPAIPDMSSPPQ